jgi:hypothetical protein
MALGHIEISTKFNLKRPAGQNIMSEHKDLGRAVTSSSIYAPFPFRNLSNMYVVFLFKTEFYIRDIKRRVGGGGLRGCWVVRKSFEEK